MVGQSYRRPIVPAYYIEDCRISDYHSIQFITANTEDGFYYFVASKQNTSNGCAKSGSYLGQNLYEITLHGIFNPVRPDVKS